MPYWHHRDMNPIQSCTKPLPYGTEWTTRDVAANGSFIGLLITEAAAQILLILQKRWDIDGGYSGSELWWRHDLDTLFVLLGLLRGIYRSPVQKEQVILNFLCCKSEQHCWENSRVAGKIETPCHSCEITATVISAARHPTCNLLTDWEIIAVEYAMLSL